MMSLPHIVYTVWSPQTSLMESLSHVLRMQNEQICGNSLLAAVLKYVSCYVCNTFVILVILLCGHKIPWLQEWLH